MRVSDIVGGMNATSAPQIGLVVFLGVFIALVARLYLRKGHRAIDARAAAMALDDGARAPEPMGGGLTTITHNDIASDRSNHGQA